MHCDRITADPTPTVECTIPVNDPGNPDTQGSTTPVASILHEGTVALDPSATLRDALTMLQGEGRRSVAVVDDAHVLVGVVHEAAFIVPRARDGALPEDLNHAMSSALAIHESVPIRHALRLLASAHLREATVVDDAHVPLGVFRDIDGLRWIVQASHSTPPPKIPDDGDRS